MNILRQRAQQQFPTVLLTLLSIVQALALELLWEHLQDSSYPLELSWGSFVSWLQIITTLLGITLIWVAYASNAMRFRWTPSTGDSVYPFIIGLLEFWQIALLGPDTVGQWTILMGVIFAAMVLVSQLTMRSARLSGENGSFFDDIKPATWRDFIPHISVSLLLVVVGYLVWLTGSKGLVPFMVMASVFALLVWQFYSAAKFWKISMNA